MRTHLAVVVQGLPAFLLAAGLHGAAPGADPHPSLVCPRRAQRYRPTLGLPLPRFLRLLLQLFFPQIFDIKYLMKASQGAMLSGSAAWCWKRGIARRGMPAALVPPAARALRASQLSAPPHTSGSAVL